MLEPFAAKTCAGRALPVHHFERVFAASVTMSQVNKNGKRKSCFDRLVLLWDRFNSYNVNRRSFLFSTEDISISATGLGRKDAAEQALAAAKVHLTLLKIGLTTSSCELG